MVIPHWAEPTHAMQIFRYVEQGSIGFLWVAGTNPAVSLPELARVRRVLAQESAVPGRDRRVPHRDRTSWPTCVLPAALWGEKTGTYTNADRTVHLSEQAVPPPGQARSDLDIWLDYARRMDLRDRSGRPLPPLGHGRGVRSTAWRDCSRGRPCDYSGLTYDKLRGGPGVQWPCTEDAPDGTERIYTDAPVPHRRRRLRDLRARPDDRGGGDRRWSTGAARYDGRARLKAAQWTPPPENPDGSYPLALNTGRTVYHFHTRTKTGRAHELDAAAPEAWVELAPEDAGRARDRRR